MRDYTLFRRIENRILTLARERGFNGNSFAEPPRFAPVSKELAAEDIVLAAGFNGRNHREKELARQIARAVVLSSTVWPAITPRPAPRIQEQKKPVRKYQRKTVSIPSSNGGRAWW